MYDVHSLVKSFYPDDEVSIFTVDNEKKCAEEYDILLEIDIPEYTDRKAAKDHLKREIYRHLSGLTGKTLPWGTLSGIRPTKIPMKMITEAESERTAQEASDSGKEQFSEENSRTDGETVKAEISKYMKETYLTSDEKIGLAIRVASKEYDLLKPLSLGEKTYSLYVNIPFCPSICLYCTFSSSPVDRWEKELDGYLDTMIEEMQKTHDGMVEIGYNAGPLTVYIGGGTPTALDAGRLDRLLTAIEEIWDLSHMVELTVEAGRPDSFTPEKLKVLKQHGVQRISVNPQTMNQKTLDLIGRHHTVEDTVNAFHMAREAGFDNINMDMILGLPSEEAPEVAHTLDEIRKLRPDSLTIHSLAIKRASRLRKTIREDREKDAGADYGDYEGMAFDNSEELMDMATSCATELGMEPYYLYRQKNMRGNLENTGFSVPGKECLYNILIMEEKQSILAFGAGASTKRVQDSGRIDRVVNPKDIRTYEAKAQELTDKKVKLFSALDG